MAKYEKVIFTRKGRSLFERSFLGNKLEFTKIELASKRNSNEEAESLVEVNQVFTVNRFEIESTGKLEIFASGNNLDLLVGYYLNCIGLYALDPVFGNILVAFVNAGIPDYIEPWTSRIGITNMDIGIVLSISNADMIDVVIQESSYASVAEMQYVRSSRLPTYLSVERPDTTEPEYYWHKPISSLDDVRDFVNGEISEHMVEFITGKSEKTLFEMETPDEKLKEPLANVLDDEKELLHSMNDKVAVITTKGGNKKNGNKHN